MSKSVNLPLYDEFLKIFIEHEIVNWQAKHFWEKMVLNHRFISKHERTLMYVGLKVLLKCKYLEVDVSKSSKKAFSYNETSRLNDLRSKHKKQKLEPILLMKKTEFLKEINDKENNIQFIESLLSDDKTLQKYFINHKKRLENDINNIKSNIRFIDNMMN